GRVVHSKPSVHEKYEIKGTWNRPLSLSIRIPNTEIETLQKHSSNTYHTLLVYTLYKQSHLHYHLSPFTPQPNRKCQSSLVSLLPLSATSLPSSDSSRTLPSTLLPPHPRRIPSNPLSTSTKLRRNTFLRASFRV